MTKLPGWLWIGVALVTAGLVYVALAPETVEVHTAVVRRGTLESWIEERGRTTLQRTVLITMPLDGRVLPITLQPGDHVQAGQTVARLAPESWRIRLDIATAEVERLKSLLHEHDDDRLENNALKSMDQTLASVAALVEELADDPTVHVGLVILPLSPRDRVAHERFVADVRERHARAHGGSPPFAMAAFHPDAAPDLGSPARLVPFIRRSPDPTIQLVRLSVLEELRRPFERGTGYVDPADLAAVETLLAAPAKKPLHERIARSNLETVERVGVEAFEELLADIRRDRDESYAAILRRR